ADPGVVDQDGEVAPRRDLRGEPVALGEAGKVGDVPVAARTGRPHLRHGPVDLGRVAPVHEHGQARGSQSRSEPPAEPRSRAGEQYDVRHDPDGTGAARRTAPTAHERIYRPPRKRRHMAAEVTAHLRSASTVLTSGSTPEIRLPSVRRNAAWSPRASGEPNPPDRPAREPREERRRG